MKLGLAIHDTHRAGAEAQRAEEMGFDYVLSGEHVFFHGPTPNAFVTLAAAAAATDRIQLLSAVTLVPLYPAALLAKMACAVDVISAGRFNLGVGVGGEYPPEFEAVGIPTSERGKRTDEALEVCRRLFTGEPTSFDGRWSTITNQRLQPPPTRPGGPPIWIAGRNEPGIRRAGRYADVWMPYMVTPGRFSHGLAAVHQYAADAGRDPSTIEGSLFAFISVDKDGTRARNWAAEIVGANYNQDFTTLSRYLISGTPAECVNRLGEFAAAGVTSAQLVLAVPPEHAATSLDLLGSEVVPEVP